MLTKIISNKIMLSLLVAVLVIITIGALIFVNNSTNKSQDLVSNTDNTTESVIQKAAVEFENPTGTSGFSADVDIESSLDFDMLSESFNMTGDARLNIFKTGSISETEDMYQFPVDFFDADLRSNILQKIPDFEIVSNRSLENARQIAFYNKALDTWRIPKNSVKDLLVMKTNGTEKWYYLSLNKLYVSDKNFVNPQELTIEAPIDSLNITQLSWLVENKSLLIRGVSDRIIGEKDIRQHILKITIDQQSGGIQDSVYVGLSSLFQYVKDQSYLPISVSKTLDNTKGTNQEEDIEVVEDFILVPEIEFRVLPSEKVLIRSIYYQSLFFVIDFNLLDFSPKVIDTLVVTDPGWSALTCSSSICYLLNFATKKVFSIDTAQDSIKIQTSSFEYGSENIVDYKELLRAKIYAHDNFDKLLSIKSKNTIQLILPQREVLIELL